MLPVAADDLTLPPPATEPSPVTKAAAADPGPPSTAPLEWVEKAGRYTEIGSSGLQHTGGHVRDEFLPALAGDRALRIYREMRDNDPVIGALFFAIDMLVRQVEWRVDPPEASSVEEIMAKRQAERAKAIQAAQAAADQREQMAEAAAKGVAGEGGPGMAPKKDAAGGKKAATPPAKVAKALELWGLDPTDFSLVVKGAAALPVFKAADDGIPEDEKPGKGKGEAKGKTDKTDPAALLATDPRTVDPLEAAQVEGEEVAIFIETCFNDMEMSWADTISTILSMLAYGFHVSEIVYKKRAGVKSDTRISSRYDDGKIGWRKFAPRAQDTRLRWEIDREDGRLRGMHQMDPSSGKGSVFIPWEKMLLFRTTTERNSPEGRSVLRNIYRPWFFKRRIEEIEAIGIERDLAGLPIAYVPYQMMSGAATEEEQAALTEIKKIVRNIKRDEQEGVVFPMAIDPESGQKMYELSLLSTGGSRQFDTDKIIARYDQRIAMTVLADFILLGHEQVGSFSLGQTKADLFTSALEAWLDTVSDVINTYAIPRLLKVNGMDPSLSPKLTHGKLSQVDLSALGEYLSKISTAGAPLFPDDALEGHLREVAGLPGKAESEDI